MKGVEPVIAYILVFAITLSVIVLIMQIASPATERSQEILLMTQSKNIMKSIDSAIKQVTLEGTGSTRVLDFTITGAQYVVDSNVTCYMESEHVIFTGSKVEDNLYTHGSLGAILMELYYENLNLVGNAKFGKGSVKIAIRNTGYESGKQNIELSVS